MKKRVPVLMLMLAADLMLPAQPFDGHTIGDCQNLAQNACAAEGTTVANYCVLGCGADCWWVCNDGNQDQFPPGDCTCPG